MQPIQRPLSVKEGSSESSQPSPTSLLPPTRRVSQRFGFAQPFLEPIPSPQRCTVGCSHGRFLRLRAYRYRRAFVQVNNARHTGAYATEFQRQATITHELGHAIVLAHDGLGDGVCGGAIPRTVMDYDCLDPPGNILNTPQGWDSCGINHAYNDPNWGFSGC